MILAILAVTLLFFYLSAPSPSLSQSIQPVSHSPHATNGGLDIVQELTEKKKDKEQETLSNKFFEYLGSHRDTPKPVQGDAEPAVANAPAYPSYSSSNAQSLDDPVCRVLAKGAEDLLVVVKTAASDIYTQLPSRFLTNLRCAPVVLFSTVSHSIGSYIVHDALSNITSEVQGKHREFELYAKLRSAQRAFQDFTTLKEDGDHNLDKWALIPSLVAAYNMHPAKKWFVYIQGDTYLSLPNVLSWVGQLDSNVPFYAGAQVMLGGTELASSSAGIVLSNAAVAALAKLYEDRQKDWEEMTGTRCCGDQVLAEALMEAKISVLRSFPNIQGENPLSLEWSPRHWCKAAVTWHKMAPALMDMLWQFERNWTIEHTERLLDPTPTTLEKRNLKTATTSTSISASLSVSPSASPSPSPSSSADFSSSIGIPPILFKNYFEGFLIPLMGASQNRSDWDNFSSALTYTDTTRTSSYAHSSPDTCRAACDIRSKCVQFVHEPNKCRLGTTVRFGEAVNRDKNMNSGWLLHRVEKFALGMGVCSEGDAFYMPGPEEPKKPETDVPDEPLLDEAEGMDAVPTAADAQPTEGSSSGR